MYSEVAGEFALLTGRGDAESELSATDLALIAAGVGQYNLVKVSSVLPKGCRRVSRFSLPAGTLLPAAYGLLVSAKMGQAIGAAVAVALPKAGAGEHGLIMEHSCYGSAADAEREARFLVREGMARRGFDCGELLSASIDHVVERLGAVFACVALLRAPETEAAARQNLLRTKAS